MVRIQNLPILSETTILYSDEISNITLNESLFDKLYQDAMNMFFIQFRIWPNDATCPIYIKQNLSLKNGINTSVCVLELQSVKKSTYFCEKSFFANLGFL